VSIIIRPLEEEDARTSVRWRNIPDIWRYTKSAPDKQITLEDELNWIHDAISDERSARFAIIVDDTYVGNIYLTEIDDKSAEFHIFIGEKSYWGKGVAKEASKQIIKYARDTLGLKRICLEVKRENVAAYRAYRKLGFEHGVYKNGFETMCLNLKEGTDGE
jgi:diamine N-acetyltransferase